MTKFILLILLFVSGILTKEEFDFFNSRCDPKCIFQPYHIDSDTIKLFPTNCTSVCAYILIDKHSDITETQLTSAFKNMKVLYGNIVVQVTNLTSMGFLSGLETVECEGYGSNDQIEVDSNPAMIEVGMTSLENTSCNIEVSRNSNLKTLGLPNLKNFYNLNPEASELNKISLNVAENTTCVTVQEVTHFMSSDYFDYEINGVDFCQLSSYSILIDDEKVCEINNFSLSTFDSSCKRITGNVLIKAGDEEYVNRMKNVTWIYGSLWIYDTQLSAVDFFDNLQYVANVKDPTKAVVIQSNPNLVTAVFPKLKRVRTDIEFRNNNQEFNLDISLCFETKQGINATVWRRTVVDGVHCKKMYESDNSQNNDSRNSIRMEFKFCILSKLFCTLG
ncbi:unnamed protein product [Caenorhabditis brenneri]